MRELLIEVRGLHHTYMEGTPQASESLRGVDFDVHRGEVVALIGPTGSGKSTLMQHLNGIIRPQSGTVMVMGKDLSDSRIDPRPLRRSIGLVFQRPEDQLFEQYTGDDVAYGPRLMGISGKSLSQRVRWAMEIVGLSFEEFKDRPVFMLSGGERRKAGLAGVIALRPEVLLLDEPTSGLDPVARTEFLMRLKTLNKEGMTLVIATHSMDDVAILAEGVYVLDNGRIAMSGSTGKIFSKFEKLRSLGLDVPASVSLMAALKSRGWPVPLDVLTVDEAVKEILGAISHLSRGGISARV